MNLKQNGLLSYTLPITALGMIASVSGIFTDIYARETTSWAAQGMAQDYANICVAFPLFCLFAYHAKKGSLKAYLSWIGVLIYIVYSYLLYTFFIHFSWIFLIYLPLLSISFYVLLATLMSLKPEEILGKFNPHTSTSGIGKYLISLFVLFNLLWLSEIVPAIIQNQPLASALEGGFHINPVHIMDLGFFLPALGITGVLLLKHKAWGYVLALPLLTTGAVLGFAVVGMAIMMVLRGVMANIVPGVIIGTYTLLNTVIAFRFSRKIPS